MHKLIIHFLFLLLLPCFITARQIETFYGSIEVEEPVLLELIDHPMFQRLKHIHQYGVCYYTTHQEEYNRYDHSIGVFTLLRANQCSLKEQIAGLLHDVSHTAFSHVGDWVFGKENQEKDYQNAIHAHFLEESGLAEVLKKYHLTVEQILPHEELFPALENSLPNLCADRIDYNIQGAYYQGFISKEEALMVFNDLYFDGERWISQKPELMKKICHSSFFMTQNCWGGPTNYVLSRWLADAILRAIDIGCISFADFHYGTDQDIWNKLQQQNDAIIAKKMQMILNAQDYFHVVETSNEADIIVKSKFRGINPWILSHSAYKRLTEIDEQIAQEYAQTKEDVNKGWNIKFK